MAAVSARALISRLPIAGSFAHDVDSTVMWSDVAVSLFSKGLMANHFT